MSQTDILEPGNAEERAELLAGEILRNARTTILLSMRFLESALFQLNPAPADTTIATNGQQLYYGFEYLFNAYREENVFVTRAILHTLMHCVFRHPFVAGTIDSELWDLACDVAAESAIDDLGVPTLKTRRNAEQTRVLAELKADVPSLAAERLYRHFITHPDKRQYFLDLAPLFHVCDHSLWYSPEDDDRDSDERGEQGEAGESGESSGQGGDTSQKGSDDDGRGNSGGSQGDEESEDSPGSGEPQANGDSPQTGEGERDDSRDGGEGDGSRNRREPSGVSSRTKQWLSEKWEDISRHVQVDMETFSKLAGSEAGAFAQQLQNLNREKYDYRTFLKRFAVKREVMKINDDEFDYIFYTYGLKLYEKMPLIEPLEYKEEPRIRDFVIVIDTSGSTSGQLVQTFLQKTYNILMSTETFDSRVNIHIIQCDARIQDAQKITSPQDFERYMKNMKILGLGGTDFRPPFEYVDQLIRSGELTDLRGLIYFTDGYGTFPSKKPAYDAAFVFIREEYEEPDIPPWAIKLVLDTEDVELA